MDFVVENELELKLKSVLGSISKFYGEEVAEEVLLSFSDIKKSFSLNMGVDLGNYDKLDIYGALLKTAILSSKFNYLFLEEGNEQLTDTNIRDAIVLIDTFLGARKEVAKTYIDNVFVKNEELLKKNSNPQQAIDSINLLNSYIEKQKELGRAR